MFQLTCISLQSVALSLDFHQLIGTWKCAISPSSNYWSDLLLQSRYAMQLAPERDFLRAVLSMLVNFNNSYTWSPLRTADI